jgi:hypothetical protein
VSNHTTSSETEAARRRTQQFVSVAQWISEQQHVTSMKTKQQEEEHNNLFPLRNE